MGNRVKVILPSEEEKENNWCHYVLDGKCNYPDIVTKRGYCWSSTECSSRPYFPNHRGEGLHGCTPLGAM